MSKLVATSLEQLSRMCWAVNWARLEKEQSSSAAHAKQGRPRPPVDVRMNFVLGDAVDTCDAICLLSSEGLAAWGKARDGHEVGGGDEKVVVLIFLVGVAVMAANMRTRLKRLCSMGKL